MSAAHKFFPGNSHLFSELGQSRHTNPPTVAYKGKSFQCVDGHFVLKRGSIVPNPESWLTETNTRHLERLDTFTGTIPSFSHSVGLHGTLAV
jgi:hypothetical protein